MSAEPIHQDGNLPSALRGLDDAIHALTGAISQFIDGKLYHAPSRYVQLWDAVSGEQSNVGTGGGSKSRPPFWLDSFDLLNEIDQALEVWQPAYTGSPATVGRVHWLRQRKWRPQDSHQVEQIARAIAEWAHSIDTLLDPPRHWTLPSPCPACDTSTVYRKDAAGETVRQPALHLTPQGCVCQRCKAHWPPDKFEWLATVLGYEKPAWRVDE